MEEFYKKLLWVAVPVFIAAGVTLVPGPREEVQLIVYAVLILIAMAGVWATNLREHRVEREAKEAERWDALNSRFDALNERLDKGDQADRAMLRTELVRGHREWVEERGYITLEALEVFKRVHKAYNAVGGNDIGDLLWEDIAALPIEEHREETA